MNRLNEIINDYELRADILNQLGTPSLIDKFKYDPDEVRVFIEQLKPEGIITQDQQHLYSIVKLIDRPVLSIRHNSYSTPYSEIWHNRLNDNRQNIEQVIPSVGRIEVRDHPSFNWLGTGWLITPDIIVTNRHIATDFSERKNNEYVYKHNNFSKREIQARVDFKEEYRQTNQIEFKITDILHIEPEGGSDVAFLRVSQQSDANTSLAVPIPLSSSAVTDGDYVAVIGYPARDSRSDFEEMERIFKSIYNVKRLSPGQAYLSDIDGLIRHDCSTLGGNSGSVVFNIETGEAVGLHFEGKYLDYNHAVSSAVISALLAPILK